MYDETTLFSHYSMDSEYRKGAIDRCEVIYSLDVENLVPQSGIGLRIDFADSDYSGYSSVSGEHDTVEWTDPDCILLVRPQWGKKGVIIGQFTVFTNPGGKKAGQMVVRGSSTFRMDDGQILGYDTHGTWANPLKATFASLELILFGPGIAEGTWEIREYISRLAVSVAGDKVLKIAE
jgi:hypothetical protein